MTEDDKDVGNILDQVDDLITEAVGMMTEVTASDLGLDYRAGHTLFVSDAFIACSTNTDRELQYYGGFEY